MKKEDSQEERWGGREEEEREMSNGERGGRKRREGREGDVQGERGGRKRRRCAKEKRKEGTYFSLSSLSLLILFNSLTFHASYSSSWGQGDVQPVKQKCFVLRRPWTTDCNSYLIFIVRVHNFFN